MAALARDESEHAAAVIAFVDTFSHAHCAACRCSLNISDSDIDRFFTGECLDFHGTCFACGEATCMACNSLISASTPMLSTITIDGRSLRWHCDAGRYVYVWAVLCGLDQATTAGLPNETDTVNNLPIETDAGISKGVGYALSDGDEYFVEAESKTGAEQTDVVNLQDAFVRKAMSTVAAIINGPELLDQSVSENENPPSFRPSLILRSSILDHVAELLRNSSPDDISKRIAVYHSLSALVRALYKSGLDMETLVEPRRINKLGHNLLKLSFGAPTRVEGEPEAVTKPLVILLEAMVDQGAALLQSTQTYSETHSTEVGDNAFKETLRMYSELKDNLALIHERNPTAHTDCNSEGVLLDQYAWQKELSVLEASDDEIQKTYSMDNDSEKLVSGQPPIGRMSRILTEIASLKASLPPNIFIRYAETRPDHMKVLIVGPEGTPYENGLFEFDLLCPFAFPNRPPKMFLRTTGHGRVRFNPNLYSNGKVCFSLLNTWPGRIDEQWDAKRSTLLQLLVSIQAMIFCRDPWFNEPGRERELGTAEAAQKSKSHDVKYMYGNVVKYAMLEWIPGDKSQDHGGDEPDWELRNEYEDEELETESDTVPSPASPLKNLSEKVIPTSASKFIPTKSNKLSSEDSNLQGDFSSWSHASGASLGTSTNHINQLLELCKEVSALKEVLAAKEKTAHVYAESALTGHPSATSSFVPLPADNTAAPMSQDTKDPANGIHPTVTSHPQSYGSNPESNAMSDILERLKDLKKKAAQLKEEVGPWPQPTASTESYDIAQPSMPMPKKKTPAVNFISSPFMLPMTSNPGFESHETKALLNTSSVFDDVAKLHFEHNRDKIIETVGDWMKETKEYRKQSSTKRKTQGLLAALGPPKKQKLTDNVVTGAEASEATMQKQEEHDGTKEAKLQRGALEQERELKQAEQSEALKAEIKVAKADPLMSLRDYLAGALDKLVPPSLCHY